MQNQGEFTTGDYEEIMNKASALSLVSNAILYWNTSRISNIVNELRKQGETEDDDTLAHISLLPYKHWVYLDMGKNVILDSVTHLLRDIVGIGSAPRSGAANDCRSIFINLPLCFKISKT